MKKKYLLMGAAGVLVLSTVVGGTLAALNVNTENGAGAATADISVKSIDVSINQGGTGAAESETGDVKAEPGGDLMISRNVTNTASDGYDAYIKAVIYKSWTDATDKYIDTSATPNLQEDIVYAGNTQLTQGQIVNGWYVGYADDEQIVLYYTKPIASGTSTQDFIDKVSFSDKLNNAYTKAEYQMDFEVKAVQKNNGVDAIAAELGVFPHFAQDGTITSVEETKFAGYSEQAIQ